MSQGSSHPWPKAFSNVGDAHVDLDWMRFVGLDMYYVDGYKTAADRLVDAVATDPHLVFPIGYMYRQYLEVHLKYILSNMRSLNVMTLADRDVHGHHLDKLWAKTRACIEKKWQTGRDPDLDGVETVILDFHNTDPTGQELRYARTTSGDQSLEKLPSSVSLGGLRDTLSKVYEVLNSCSQALDGEIMAMQNDKYNEAMDKLEAEQTEE